MTESARVKRYTQTEGGIAESANGELVMIEDYNSVIADRDAQAALVERMREYLQEIKKRPHDEHCPALRYYPKDDDLCECHQSISREALVISRDASSALQEFKERCWKQAIEETLAQGGDIENWSNEMLQQQVDEIVAELKKEGPKS